MKYTGPKVRLSRRLGIPLTAKAARIMEKRSYPPGQHGPAKQYRRGRISAYERQLLEKQRLRSQYNIHERQMRNYYRKSAKKEGNTVDILVQMLESRLDAAVLRAGLAPTIYAARQYVNHGHLQVNGKKVNIPSYQLKVGDVVDVRPKSQRMSMFQDVIENAYPPDYIALDKGKMSFALLYLPRREEVPIVCEVAQVIEYYSR
ncbi:MAG: 30S ribosomal protein S4 [Ardenticatenaceae bacterium]|nr:30S ribosomal protein S4 [Ardenticatenaceae bacterium]